MTKVLLIDAGGVLFNNVTEETPFIHELAQYHRVDADLLRQEIDSHDGEYETNSRHVHEVLSDCLIRAGSALSIRPAWIDSLYLANVKSYDEAFEALRKLVDNRRDVVVAMANNEAKHWDDLKNIRYGHLGMFDVIGSSWSVRALKPSASFFERVAKLCNASLGEAMLIDDNPEVVGAAAAIGLRSVCVSTPGNLASILAEFGRAG